MSINSKQILIIRTFLLATSGSARPTLQFEITSTVRMLGSYIFSLSILLIFLFFIQKPFKDFLEPSSASFLSINRKIVHNAPKYERKMDTSEVES